LRRTWHAWQSLHGEIDFDDLLVAKALYTAAPEAYAFINSHEQNMRKLSDSLPEGAITIADENRKLLHEQWEKATKEVSLDREAAHRFMDFLFPGWLPKTDSSKLTAPLQGVAKHLEHTNYWIRLNRESLSPSEISDQKAIQAIEIWKKEPEKTVYQDNGKELTLSQALLSPGSFAEKILQFEILLNGEEVRSVASEIFDIIRQNIKIHSHIKDYPVLSEWRLLTRRKSTDNHDMWLLEEIRKAIPISLDFATDLYAWRKQNPIKDKLNSYKTLRTGFLREAKAVYENNPDALLKSLEADKQASISELMYLCGNPETESSPISYAEWGWLIDVLIEAGEKSPQIILPQLAPLIVDTGRYHAGVQWSFKGAMDTLFPKPDLQNRAINLFSREIDLSRLDEKLREALESVRNEVTSLTRS